MIFPTTYEMTLLISVLSMICWGSWANTLKLAQPKWRFELYYFDFAFGLLVAAVVAAFTFGSMGDELTFGDNLMIAGKRPMIWAMAAGAVFNLANLLLVAAISIAGMSVAFPIGIGLALVVGTAGNYIMDKTGNPMFIFGGIALILIAIVLDALAYSSRVPAQEPLEPPPDPRARRPKRKNSGPMKAILLSVVGGILMGCFYPLVLKARAVHTEIGLGPYPIAVFFAVGVFFSTFVYNLYFINLPVQGEAVQISQYFRGTAKHHLLGFLGGAIWCVGAVANFVAAAATGKALIGPAVSYALGQGATMISALWGLLVWKEFKGAGNRSLLLLALMFVFFLAGLALLALAPRHTTGG